MQEIKGEGCGDCGCGGPGGADESADLSNAAGPRMPMRSSSPEQQADKDWIGEELESAHNLRLAGIGTGRDEDGYYIKVRIVGNIPEGTALPESGPNGTRIIYEEGFGEIEAR